MKNNEFNRLVNALSNISTQDASGKELEFSSSVSKIAVMLKVLKKKENKVFIIGNGGSASIAGHIATDLLKNCAVPALSFTDPSLITCISNDLGYEYVYQKPIELLAKKGDILFSVSSSGESKNILNAAKKARELGCFLITLSGFSKANKLRKAGSINFYVPSSMYGEVEITHLAILHSIVDKLSKK